MRNGSGTEGQVASSRQSQGVGAVMRTATAATVVIIGDYITPDFMSAHHTGMYQCDPEITRGSHTTGVHQLASAATVSA